MFTTLFIAMTLAYAAAVSADQQDTGEDKKSPAVEQASTKASARSIPVNCDTTNTLGGIESKTEYTPFLNETVTNESGYGIYFVKAHATLDRKILENGIDILKISYGLPPHFNWGNWLSIRKEFVPVLDFSDCTGIEFDLKVLEPSSAKLRLTVLDVGETNAENNRGSDEMWWHDFDIGLLNKSGEWILVRAPFENFRLSYGQGTRHNDGKFDTSRIIGYEINLVSSQNDHPVGIIKIGSIRPY
jgi:hypothetical protein